MNEQNLRQRFRLRSGHCEKYVNSQHEPMTVGHYRPTGQCVHCKKWRHKVRDCPFRRKQIISYRARPSMSEIVCWRCNKKGHFRRYCKEANKRGRVNKIPTYKINLAGSPNSCLIRIENPKYRSLIDSGAEVYLIHKRVFDSLKTRPKLI